jgi:hypothetical protein
MLPLNFAPLASAEPRFAEVTTALDRWIATHKTWKWLVPGIVANDIPSLDVFDLAEALSSAVRNGILRLEYTVLTPSGVLADESYESPAKIPRRMADREENYFETTSLPIVPVYMSSETASAR